MRLPPRRLLAAACALVLLLLGTSLVLPPGAEIRRTRDLTAPRAVIHPWLAEPGLWSRWAPDWMRADSPGSQTAVVTAALPQRGVWCDLAGLGARVGKSAILYSDTPGGTPGETRITWILRTDVGFDPFRRWTALLADGRYGPQMEAALERLAESLP